MTQPAPGDLSALLYALPQQAAQAPVFIGLDPGASGGIAFVHGHRYEAHKMPATMRDVFDLLSEIKARGPTCAVLERVSAMPGQGVASTFKFGASYGSLKMALISAGISFEEVTPAKWQRALSIPKRTGTETKTQHKNKLKTRAQELFPEAKITLATADALLLAHYARLIR